MKPLIEGKTLIQLDLALIVPDGWHLIVADCDTDTEARTLTPRGDQSRFGLYRLPQETASCDTLPSRVTGEITAALLEERRRQQEVEGWTLSHDANHQNGELAHCAAAYLMAGPHDAERGHALGRSLWEFAGKDYRPSDLWRNLVRGGALLIAEMERLHALAAGYHFYSVDEDSEVYAARSREALDELFREMNVQPDLVEYISPETVIGVDEAGTLRRPAWQALIDAIGMTESPSPAFQLASAYN
ncbi:hypothetical protein IHN63_02175 [Deinococcus sp. 6YEL10]|uniref:hypothetical protein n=1 Tax=Deinococcus sp. 6YEL10 TaxID=2745870 RepID=UPI001E5B0325|nr:hypothetical protein [Deinococcus sp. 6YEL10]MCD0160107.1 hypothetical protein [Deinococcus sp. 6YEL10]